MFKTSVIIYKKVYFNLENLENVNRCGLAGLIGKKGGECKNIFEICTLQHGRRRIERETWLRSKIKLTDAF